MTATTRTIAKGIPLRVHDPKPKGNATTSKPKKIQQRTASESEDSEPMKKQRGKKKKRQ